MIFFDKPLIRGVDKKNEKLFDDDGFKYMFELERNDVWKLQYKITNNAVLVKCYDGGWEYYFFPIHNINNFVALKDKKVKKK